MRRRGPRGPRIANAPGPSRCSIFPIQRRGRVSATTCRFFQSFRRFRSTKTTPRSRPVRFQNRAARRARKPKARRGRPIRKRLISRPAKKQTAGKEGSAKEPKDPPPSPNGKVIPVNATPNPSPSAAERAILERLQERRQELEKRARELDIREGLIADAEKRVESKLMQIKEGQQQLSTAAQKKDEAEAARFKSLVTMYETMKPRDAAKIFDRLEVNVLLQVASMMNPRSMSEVLALMTPDRAEQLTVELANRAKTSPKDPSANLPKIEGHPTGQ